MSRWFRHYAGMMRDDKLVRAAMQSKQPVERVVWIWGAVLESAAEINDGGKYDLDAAETAYFLRADEADIRAVLNALAKTGRLAEGHVVHWSDRQFDSDRSASRQAAYRKRKQSARSDGDDQQANADDERPSPDQLSDAVVTVASRHADAPEAETDTQTEKIISPPTVAPPNKPKTDDVREAVAIYAQVALANGLHWPSVQRLTAQRVSACRARLGEVGGIEGWRAAIERAGRSSFLGGANDKGWLPDFDFFCQSKSFTKLMEGSYDDHAGSGKTNGSRSLDTVFGALAEIATSGPRSGERQADPDVELVGVGHPARRDPSEDRGLEIPAFMRRTA